MIALDNRGHGASTKLYDPDQYDTSLMAEDVRALLDHLEIEQGRCDGLLHGRAYHRVPRVRASRTGAFGDPRRARQPADRGARLRRGDGRGAGSALARATSPTRAAACSASSPSRRNPICKALAACTRGSRQSLTREQAASIRVPLLVAVGTRMTSPAPPQELAAVVPGAQALVIAGRDHMLAVGDKVFKAGVLEFLEERP